MKKLTIISYALLALGVLALFVIAVFFQFYTYNEDGGIKGDWRLNESIMYLGTARIISLISGTAVALGIILLFISQNKSIRKQSITGMLFIALGTIIIVGSLNSFYPCTDMMRMNDRPMRCYWTMKSLLGITGAIGISGVLMLFFGKSRDFVKGLNCAVIMFSCLYLLIPIKITEGFCSTIMPCIERFRPFTIIIGSFILFIAVLNIFLLKKISKRQA